MDELWVKQVVEGLADKSLTLLQGRRLDPARCGRLAKADQLLDLQVPLGEFGRHAILPLGEHSGLLQ